jgi:hypothetical protein
MIDIITQLNNEQNISSSALPHCSNLMFQLQKSDNSKIGLFNTVVTKYVAMRKVDSSLEIKEYISKITLATNDYLNVFWPPSNNPFSHQADFGSSIIPEMLCLIFNYMI